MITKAKAARIARGLTIPQLAQAADVPYHVARRADRGEPIRENSAKRVADVLGLVPMDLVEPNGDDDSPAEAAA